MDFEFSQKSKGYLERLGAFMDEHVYPNEERFYAQLKEGERWKNRRCSRNSRPGHARRGCGICSCPIRTTARG